MAMTDLTQGRNPLDRITPQTEPASSPPAPPAGPSPAPVPALVNLLVPAATLLGLSTTPGLAGGWGLLDADDTRTLVTAAAGHPATRWCLTLTGRHRHRPRLRPRPPPPSPERPGAPATARPGGPARSGGRAGTARRAAAPPEPQPHPHRPGVLRPRRHRGPLLPQPQAEAPGPRPQRDLRRSRLPEPRHKHRLGSHHRVAPRPDEPIQSRTAVQTIMTHFALR
jgi:hypothetical protein